LIGISKTVLQTSVPLALIYWWIKTKSIYLFTQGEKTIFHFLIQLLLKAKRFFGSQFLILLALKERDILTQGKAL